LGSNSVAHKFNQKVLNFCENSHMGKQSNFWYVTRPSNGHGHTLDGCTDDDQADPGKSYPLKPLPDKQSRHDACRSRSSPSTHDRCKDSQGRRSHPMYCSPVCDHCTLHWRQAFNRQTPIRGHVHHTTLNTRLHTPS
jgi:hypothetical protein